VGGDVVTGGRVYGYARCSTEEQAASGLGLAAQRAAILGRYPEAEIREETASGARAARPVLAEVLDGLRRGDVLVVATLSRLVRNVRQAAELLDRSMREGWALVALDTGIDTGTVMGRAMAQMAAVFAELERAQTVARTVAACDVRDPQVGARRLQIRRLLDEGLGCTAVARALGCHRTTVLREAARPRV
jgi:DNA invertase Pin-like site-specific DNA recombinase